MERILVCISNPYHAEKLIQRGKVLADAFKGECVVLNVLRAPYDELDFNQLQTKIMFESLAEKYGVKIVSEPSKFKKVTSHIADFAKQTVVTQIVIGQCPHGKLMLFHDSFINSLFTLLENVDIHVVEITRDVKSEQEYDKGATAVLKKIDGKLELSFNSNKLDDDVQGIFYKSSSTDFVNGFFVITKGKEHVVLRVVDGIVEETEI